MSLLTATTQQAVEDHLVGDGIITDSVLLDAKAKALTDKKPLLTSLVSSGVINSETLAKTIAKVNNVPYVNLSEARINPDVLDLLPQDIAERYMAVPLGEIQRRLVVAMLDADNIQAVDFLSKKIGRTLKVYSASEEGIKQVLHQYQTRISKRVIGDISSIDSSSNSQKPDDSQKQAGGKDGLAAYGKDIKVIVQDSPISKALSTILEFAAKNRASDVHIEPLEDSLKIRARIDGVLREIMTLPKATEPPLISRIKILSNLKIDEHRIPQDGEFTIKVGSSAIDLRIAISPVIWGEQVVIRLLDKTGTSLKLEEMGYAGRALKTIRAGLKQSNGMILTSGPTGSGKSTSLYALLQEIKSDTINIVTLEDPVEYKMPGINQIQVNADVGLTFATGLRSILRQDPDIVMVGEIRDKETADLAVQAALTGHLVFSTLHTNSAAGILPRLLDMGVEPFLIASTVRVVIGQRLLRKIDQEHREEYQADNSEIETIKSTIGSLLPSNAANLENAVADLGYKNLPLATQDAYTLYKGKDSPDAPGGFRGRVGVYEVFNVSKDIQDLILKRSTSAEIEAMAQAQGMITMRQDGYFKALNGLTTIAEVNRVAAADNA